MLDFCKLRVASKLGSPTQYARCCPGPESSRCSLHQLAELTVLQGRGSLRPCSTARQAAFGCPGSRATLRIVQCCKPCVCCEPKSREDQARCCFGCPRKNSGWQAALA